MKKHVVAIYVLPINKDQWSKKDTNNKKKKKNDICIYFPATANLNLGLTG